VDPSDPGYLAHNAATMPVDPLIATAVFATAVFAKAGIVVIGIVLRWITARHPTPSLATTKDCLTD
jgi:hypothetical protein